VPVPSIGAVLARWRRWRVGRSTVRKTTFLRVPPETLVIAVAGGRSSRGSMTCRGRGVSRRGVMGRGTGGVVRRGTGGVVRRCGLRMRFAAVVGVVPRVVG
jgi:hypothetical protein